MNLGADEFTEVHTGGSGDRVRRGFAVVDGILQQLAIHIRRAFRQEGNIARCCSAPALTALFRTRAQAFEVAWYRSACSNTIADDLGAAAFRLLYSGEMANEEVCTSFH